MKFTKEDIELIEKFIDIKNRGYYADGKQVTDCYNRVLEKNLNVTNCGSCLRGRIQELEGALNAFKRLSEKVEVTNPTPVKEDENKPIQEEKKRVGRPKK